MPKDGFPIKDVGNDGEIYFFGTQTMTTTDLEVVVLFLSTPLSMDGDEDFGFWEIVAT